MGRRSGHSHGHSDLAISQTWEGDGATKVDQLQLKRITVRATHREFQSDNGAENCQSFMTQVTPSHLQAVVFNLVTSFFSMIEITEEFLYSM